MRIERSRTFIISLAIIMATLIFFIPLTAAAEFSFRGDFGQGHSFVNYLWLLKQDGFLENLLITLQLGAIAGILNLLLMVPTAVITNIKFPKWRPVLDFICILPLIIPVVSLAVGAQVAMPEFLQNSQYELAFFFVIIALPFTYRTLDNALVSVELKTLVEASRNLGAGWFLTIVRVIFPSIRTGVIGAIFLSFALCLGEYTLTVLLHWTTFPTWTVIASQQNILGAIALSVFSLVGAVLLMIFISIFANKRNKRLNQQVEEEFA
jgi:putative spermidine/putrescine transport system permease protein